MISIIIPIFNAESYLEECLSSILQQSYVYYEVICVNDGSTDDSSSIVKKYSTKKYLITSLEIIIILLVGSSRVYLGVHYFTDIIGAILISIAIILIANDLEIFEKYINRGNENDNKIRRNNIK